MFNQLTPSEVVTAVGVAARRAARSENPASEFDRDQLLSAYSATRHLAAELSGYDDEMARFKAALTERLSAADAAGEPGVAELRAAVEDGATAAIGAALSDLLAKLRAGGSESQPALRTDLHALLRDLADREVDIVADALG